MDPRTLAEEAKARASDWRNNNVSGLCADVCALADALITALDDVERYRREAESRARWAHRAAQTFAERNNRYRSLKAHAKNIQRENENWCRVVVDARAENENLRAMLHVWVTPAELAAALTKTPEREG